MLPSMTAAILFARRGRGFPAGVAIAAATLAKQTGAATLLPVLFLIARARGKSGMGEVALGFSIPTALVAMADRDRPSSSTGRCSATVRTSA